MAKRKHSGEINVGSDSFLDVIANIVGILIILIVVAGIHGARHPSKKRPARVPESATAPAVIAPEIASVPIAAEPEVEEPEEPEEPEFVEQTTPPAELTGKIAKIQGEIESLESATRTTEAEKKALEQRQAQGELQITVGRSTLKKVKSELDSRTRTVDELQALIASQKSNLNVLQMQLEELEKQAPKTKTLKHRVTPLSRVVVGEQLHFRLSDKKVSQVPIHDLLEAAMRQAKRHADSLLQTRSHMGTVGPTGGYLLQYKLEALPASSFDSMRHGAGMVRIALTSFQLQPDSELHEESVEEALTRGSMFDIAMQTAQPGSTFTLWVYPDSFPVYRQLQSKLHDAGFTVAGRPLPHGIPIAGSPDGSASAGQ